LILISKRPRFGSIWKRKRMNLFNIRGLQK